MARPDRITLAAAGILIVIVTLTYWNHFQNGFHFDDSHAVIDNPYIRDLHNIKLFFTDVRAFSALPSNRVYRPLVTASLALDYAIGGGLKPAYFQTSTFLWFLAQLLLMYALFRKICDAARPDPSNKWVAWFAAALYGLHPAIAETVNYVIQRGDVYSTLGVVAALSIYVLFPASRKYGWYLAPVALALLSKPPALIFPLILLMYGGLFEKRRATDAVKQCIPALVVAVLMGGFLTAMTPPTPAVASASAYCITQPLVSLRYFRTFFVPNHLTADTDFTAAGSILEQGAWLGFTFVGVLIAGAVWCSKRREWRPAAFGLWWFLLALIPTAIFPLSEVENDHRMYFPFVGLALAVSWTLAQWIRALIERPSRRRPALGTVYEGAGLKIATAGAALLVLSASAWATRARNEVWRTDESLWYDVTIKSPRNGRGLMNYGLTQMEKGDFRRAMEYFQRALVYNPNYPNLEINLGIASGGLNLDGPAEAHFRRALVLAQGDYAAHYFFGRWLEQKNRTAEAIGELELSVGLNPDYLPSRYLIMEIFSRHADWPTLRAAAESTLRRFPADTVAASFLANANHSRTADEYVNLSLAYYQARKFDECIEAAQEAIKLDPNYAAAYNNIAAAYAEMKEWDLAIHAAQQALKIRPDFRLAQNNLAWAESGKSASGK